MRRPRCATNFHARQAPLDNAISSNVPNDDDIIEESTMVDSVNIITFKLKQINTIALIRVLWIKLGLILIPISQFRGPTRVGLG